MVPRAVVSPHDLNLAVPADSTLDARVRRRDQLLGCVFLGGGVQANVSDGGGCIQGQNLDVLRSRTQEP